MNNSILILGFVSISLLLILSITQISTAQRHDDDNRHYYRDDDHDYDHDDYYRYDDDHDYRDHYRDDNDRHYDDDFELTVRLIGDEDEDMPDFTVRAAGEREYIHGEEFENDGKAKVQLYLDDVDNKERVCITDERHDFDTCKTFKTYRDEATVNFYVD
jgi:hypothetical protein